MSNFAVTFLGTSFVVLPTNKVDSILEQRTITKIRRHGHDSNN
jgi:hypothetical protein